MSKLDGLFGYGDYDSIPFDQELNVSPSWSVQNACLAFSLGPALGYKGKPRPNNKVSVPQALPSLPLESYLDSPKLGKSDYRTSWRTAEENGFSWPMGYGDQDPGYGLDTQAALKGPPEELFGKNCPVDRAGSEGEQTASSENDVVNEAIGGWTGLGGQMGFACPILDDRPSEGLRDMCSESTGDVEWEGVIKLVQELTSRFTEQCAGTGTGMENFDQKLDHKFDQKKSSCDNKTGEERPKTDPTDCSFPAGLATVKGGACGVSADEIIMALSAIQRNVDYIKDAVPNIASQRTKFTMLIKRQCAAAAGAVKLISQLADAAAGIIPEIQRQLGMASTEESCQSANDGKDSKQESGGDYGGMERLIPTLAAVSVSPPVKPVQPPPESDGSVKGNNNLGNSTGASEFGNDEKECASSLVADLLVSCDRMPGADGFVASTCSSPFQWGSELLDEAIMAGSVSQLRSEENLGVENIDDVQAPSGITGVSDEEPNLGSSSGSAATHEESDEGDTKGSDQLPLSAFTLMEIDDLEILTEQTHYCNICSKGFKRDANLRMHMRSHGGKYKSSTALIRSERAPKVVQEMVGGKPTRYSCPFVGCNRNMKHPKFQALKTMLCLKNHYRRSHCAKTLKCSICKSKQFSVVADLKTHEKHCGSDKWACSCGTTFSRKEKLYGHVSLFVGHVPVDALVAAHAAAAPEVGNLSAAPVQVQTPSLKGSLAAQLQNEAVSLWSDW
ncbi:unnamed protein product [Calypogeia fissa]